MGPELFFGKIDEPIRERRRRELQAKAICDECDVIAECFDAGKEEEGIWGGVTDADRRRTDARRPYRPLLMTPTISKTLVEGGWRLLEEHGNVRLLQRESQESWHGYEWVVTREDNTAYHTQSLEHAYMAFGKMIDLTQPR